MSFYPGWFDGEPLGQKRRYRTICDDVDDGQHTTLLHTVEVNRDGPSVVVIGGVHGGEPAGARAAGRFVNAAISSGRLTVIPEANPCGLRNRHKDGAPNPRVSPGHGDLNRIFKGGPDDEHANAIWNAIDAQNPNIVIDLHTSRWPRTMDKDAAVGQAIYPSEESEGIAETVAKRVSREHIRHSDNLLSGEWQDNRGKYYFTVGNPQGEDIDGNIVDYARYQLGEGCQVFLVEAARNGVPIEARTSWLTAVAKELLREKGMDVYGV